MTELIKCTCIGNNDIKESEFINELFNSSRQGLSRNQGQWP